MNNEKKNASNYAENQPINITVRTQPWIKRRIMSLILLLIPSCKKRIAITNITDDTHFRDFQN